MDELIKNFNRTGNCEVDTDKVAKAWNDKFSISQWHDEYRLIEDIELFKEGAYKISISKEQALEIINKVKLLPIQSGFLKNAKTWRSQSNIISEKKRIENLLKDKTDQREIRHCHDIISELSAALHNHTND